MTKILYIPTGEYLKYYCHLDLDTSKITTDCRLEEVMEKEDIEREIEEILRMGDHKNRFRNWTKLNNLSLPVLRNELEIIKDD